MSERPLPDGCAACGALPCDWVNNPHWQDIASAPKGETDLVALWNGKEVTVGARWEGGGFADWFHDWIDPQPLCWMPLPAPPATEA